MQTEPQQAVASQAATKRPRDLNEVGDTSSGDKQPVKRSHTTSDENFEAEPPGTLLERPNSAEVQRDAYQNQGVIDERCVLMRGLSVLASTKLKLYDVIGRR